MRHFGHLSSDDLIRFACCRRGDFGDDFENSSSAWSSHCHVVHISRWRSFSWSAIWPHHWLCPLSAGM